MTERWLNQRMDQGLTARTEAELRAAAERISNEILLPAAGEVDHTGVIPAGHFDALADAGLYGAAVAVDSAAFASIVETLARGCLATTFVWLQHHGLARRLAVGATTETHRRLATSLLSGHARAGIVQAGLLPGPPLLVAERDNTGGWRLDGFSPWCTGWGMVSDLLVAARIDGDPGTVAWFVIPAAEGNGLAAERLSLQAVDATVTVSLRFTGFEVAAGCFLGADDYAVVGHAAGRGLRPNGSLALGLALRCADAIDQVGTAETSACSQRLIDRVVELRRRMDVADDAALVSCRVDAVLLAVDAAVAIVAAHGARSAMSGSDAERAMREATFLLVFGSRPSIKQELLCRW